MVLPISRDEFSSAVLSKAGKYLAEKRVSIDPSKGEVVWVRGSGEHDYRVQVISRGAGQEPFVTCSCPYGTRGGGGECRCSHAAAVLEVLHMLDDDR